MTETKPRAKFPRVETWGQLKRFALASSTASLNFVVKFEVGWDVVTEVGRMFNAKVPLSLEWLPEGSDEVFPLGIVTALKPSSMSTDADGEVRFVASFALPPSSVPMCIGVLAAGLHDFPVDGPVGRLTIEQQQAELFGD